LLTGGRSRGLDGGTLQWQGSYGSLADNTLIVISGEPYGSAIATKVNWSINQIHRRVAVLKANSLPL